MSILALTSSRRQICKFKMESAFSMSGLHISKFLIHISILYYHKKKKTTRKIDSAFCHTTFALIVLLPWLNILIKVAFYRITEHVFLISMPMKYSDANQTIMLILIWFFIYILLKILKKNCWLWKIYSFIVLTQSCHFNSKDGFFCVKLLKMIKNLKNCINIVSLT